MQSVTCGTQVRMRSAIVMVVAVWRAKTATVEGSPAGIRKENDTHVGCQEVDAAVLEGAEVLCVCHLRSAQGQNRCMLPSDPNGRLVGCTKRGKCLCGGS